ncbi:ion channel [Candidatus Marsarchaeota archaeon]|nr:ion channel [Candidatus Marsarchaeota archaeon]
MRIGSQVITYAIIAFLILAIGTAVTYYLGKAGDFNIKINSLLTALYFVVVTISTVGYGDIVPITPVARVFVIILILSGLSVFLSAVTIISSGFVNSRIESLSGRISRMERRNLGKHVMLIGYGPTNAYIAKMLKQKGVKFILVVSDKVTLDKIKSFGYKAYLADETLGDDMEQFELNKARYIVIDTSDSARTLYAAIIAKNIAASKPISVVADNPDIEKHLKGIGVDHIINPMEIAAKDITERMG